MIDEKTRRRAEFVEGYPVTLADGQLWNVPRPKLRFTPKFVDGKVELAGGPTLGSDFDGDLEIIFGTVDVPGAEFLRVKFSLAVRLLRVNYELSDSELAGLIVLEPGDPASDARWEELTNAMMGNAPKPSPAI